jgi:hypothetical protein
MALAGAFFFIAVLKFGDPVILDYLVVPPENWFQAIYETWNVKWGYLLMIPLFAAGLFALRWTPFPRKPVLLLPLLWLGWECLVSSQTVSPRMTGPTLAHFTACVALFYLGFFALRGVRNPWPVWVGLALAFCWVLHSAMEQHFGGLAATRKMILENPSSVPPKLLNNPDYLKRINSDRVFGTFMYANSLAGSILLLLPVTLVSLWQAAPKLRASIRALFVAILGSSGLACLYWSGSKSAWLLMVVLGVVVMARSSMPMAWKRTLIYGLLIFGLVGFTIQYAESVARGKTSMVARLDYWKAALHIFRQHPILGSGPGTFGVQYQEIKARNSEWAALCHNDYLEQASDSGIIGFLTFSAFIGLSFFKLYRYSSYKNDQNNAVIFSVWLGLLGLFLHSFMEFHLYYPALAWPAFFLLGWLWGLEKESTQANRPVRK